MKIRINNLNKRFGKTSILKDINVTINSGEFTTILGPSGCGKTTLLRIIAGLETADSGEIFFNDKCIFSSEKKINVQTQDRNLGMVFQDFALWPHMNVNKNIAFPIKERKESVSIDDEVERLLHIVSLDEMGNRMPSQMSGGQQQRVAFARAIAGNPDIVLFDEPLSALDAILRDKMRIEICSLTEKMKLTSIYVTHDQLEAMSMSNRIIVMSRGEIQQIGTPEEIYNNPQNKIVLDFIGKSNWFEDNCRAIRPENISLKDEGYDSSLEGTVEHVSFLGERYEVTTRIKNGYKWLVYNDKRLNVGDKVKLYFNKQSLIKINE